MQAHPLSSTAARNTSTPPRPPSKRKLSSSTAPPSTPPAPSTQTPSPASVADTAGLAHDAGNFLAALGLYCDLLSAPGVLRPEHLHYATELNLISNRSSDLIRRLLSAPTASAPDFPPNPPPHSHPAAPGPSSHTPPASNLRIPNDAFVLRTLAPVLQRIAGSSASVSVHCAPSLPPLGFSCEIIERIAINLVRNAAEAIRLHRTNTTGFPLHQRGQIRVELHIRRSHLVLTVKDDGPGMPPAVAAAFLHPSPMPPGSTRGLGHRIVHELAATTSGQIEIHVTPGSGTVFSVQWLLPSISLARTTSPEHHKSPSKGSRTC